MTKKHVHTYYGFALSASAVCAGICLIRACIGIYRSGGDTPFHAASVAAAFQPIAIPVFLFLALAVGGFILNIFWPAEKVKEPVPKQHATILQKLHEKLDAEKCPKETVASIKKEQMLRKHLAWITWGVLGVCSIMFLIYGLNIRNFPKGEATAAVSKAMRFFIPCLVVPFAVAVFAAYQNKRSILREIELVKAALPHASAASKAAKKAVSKKKYINWVRWGILALSVFLIVFGYCNRGFDEVLAKAVAICRECVGLG